MFAVVITEKGGAQRRMDFDKSEVTIGRVQGNDIILPKGNVSKRHSRIVLKDNRFIVVDLKSTNGTYVNGRKITSPLVVKAGDKIYIGDFILTLEEGAAASASTPSAPPPPPNRPPVGPPPLDGPGGPPPMSPPMPAAPAPMPAAPAPMPAAPGPAPMPAAPAPMPAAPAPMPAAPAPMPAAPAPMPAAPAPMPAAPAPMPAAPAPMPAAPGPAPMPAAPTPGPTPARMSAPDAMTPPIAAAAPLAPSAPDIRDSQPESAVADANTQEPKSTAPRPSGAHAGPGRANAANTSGAESGTFWQNLVVAAVSAGKSADEAIALADEVLRKRS